jgi:Glycosyltransferase like family 2
MKFFGCPEVAAPLWLVIPTYWGTAGEGIYDHPTPLGGKSTLPRLLDSIVAQETTSEFKVLILLSTTSPALEGEAAVCVRELLSPYTKKLNLLLADAAAARFLSKKINAYSLNLRIASMRGYAAVRNMQLLVPMAFGAQVIAAVDDDEVLPPDYLSQAMKWIGKLQKDQRVIGIGGPYLDNSGNAYMTEPEEVRNILVDKSVFMNATLHQVMGEGEELNETPMAFGGNMVFHRDLFTQVGFDPAITRGEDIDYVINARIAGQVFHFDPKLTITHLPPRHFESSQYAKMRQDVIRFVYEREKIRQYGLPAADFVPYPGNLLGDDFDSAALKALVACASPELTAQFGRPEEVLREAQAHSCEAAPKYVEFASQWKKASDILESEARTEELLSLIRL